MQLTNRLRNGTDDGGGAVTDWRERLTGRLEPVLRSADPRPEISAYHDMPYAIFRYPPEEEFKV